MGGFNLVNLPPETPLESTLKGLEETPLRALNAPQPTPVQPSIIISTVTQNVLLNWEFSVGGTVWCSGNDLLRMPEQVVLTPGGATFTGLPQNQFNIIGTQPNIPNGGSQILPAIAVPPQIFAPTMKTFNPWPDSNPNDGMNVVGAFEYWAFPTPTHPWDIVAAPIVPPGMIYTGAAISMLLNIGFFTLTQGQNPSVYVKGFAVYPAATGSGACIVFCPSMIPGTISYHRLWGPGNKLSAPISAVEIDPLCYGVANDPNWIHAVLDFSEGGEQPTYAFGYPNFMNVTPGDGPPEFTIPMYEDWNGDPLYNYINCLYGNFDSLYSPSSDTTVRIWPTTRNYASKDEVIVLWLNLKPSQLPTEPFDPNDYSLLICK